jgi:D-alanyl-D-alanine carboxypeptidase
MLRMLVVALLLAACGPGAKHDAIAPPRPTDTAPAASATDLAPVLAPFAAQYELPALAAVVADSAAILGQGVVGVRRSDDPTKTKATLQDTWHLGSDTKAMTATLVAIFVENGTLGWDKTLPELFPKATIDPGYKGVTLAMLLAHVGGAPATPPTEVWSKMSGSADSRGSRLAAVEAVLARPPGAAVGTFTYSNVGYMMAGAALELATDTAWEDLLRERVFTPLGMTSCGFGPNAANGFDDPVVDQPWGHTSEGGTLVGLNVDNPVGLGPAGTVHCSVGDWLAFLREHLKGARGAATTLGLQPATWTKLHTPAANSDYALGWIVASRPWAGGAAYTHAGSNTLNVANVWIAPAIDRIYLTVANRGDTPALTAADAVIGELVARFPAPGVDADGGGR